MLPCDPVALRLVDHVASVDSSEKCTHRIKEQPVEDQMPTFFFMGKI